MLLDTHVLLWWQAGGARLSQRCAREIERADAVLVSPITCWEIAALVERGRITLDRDLYTWTADLFADDHVDVAPLSPAGAIGAGLLGASGFHGDPADRFLYATARELVVPLATKDAGIRSYARTAGDVRTVW